MNMFEFVKEVFVISINASFIYIITKTNNPLIITLGFIIIIKKGLEF